MPPTGQQIDEAKRKELMKKIEEQRKELIGVANFISDKGLKIKQASTHSQQIDYFRGNDYKLNHINISLLGNQISY